MMGIDENQEFKEKEIIPVERHGVKVISMAFFVEEMHQYMAWTYVRENVNQFLCRSEMGERLLTIRLTSRNRDVALDVHSMLQVVKR